VVLPAFISNLPFLLGDFGGVRNLAVGDITLQVFFPEILVPAYSLLFSSRTPLLTHQKLA
jgi:hypothetical protein